MNANKFLIVEQSPTCIEMIPNGFLFEGQACWLGIKDWRTLKCLVQADGPVTYRVLFRATYPYERYPEAERIKRRVSKRVTQLRGRLRGMLGLPDNWNPIPMVRYEQLDGRRSPQFALTLPPTDNRRDST